jgi:hypothetical protein
VGEYREIVEPEPASDPAPVRRGRGTIIQTSKCKRLHLRGLRICIGAVALLAVGYGAGHAYGVDAAFLAVGLTLAASTWSMR